MFLDYLNKYNYTKENTCWATEFVCQKAKQERQRSVFRRRKRTVWTSIHLGHHLPEMILSEHDATFLFENKIYTIRKIHEYKGLWDLKP